MGRQAGNEKLIYQLTVTAIDLNSLIYLPMDPVPNNCLDCNALVVPDWVKDELRLSNLFSNNEGVIVAECPVGADLPHETYEILTITGWTDNIVIAFPKERKIHWQKVHAKRLIMYLDFFADHYFDNPIYPHTFIFGERDQVPVDLIRHPRGLKYLYLETEGWTTVKFPINFEDIQPSSYMKGFCYQDPDDHYFIEHVTFEQFGDKMVISFNSGDGVEQTNCFNYHRDIYLITGMFEKVENVATFYPDENPRENLIRELEKRGINMEIVNNYWLAQYFTVIRGLIES